MPTITIYNMDGEACPSMTNISHNRLGAVTEVDRHCRQQCTRPLHPFISLQIVAAAIVCYPGSGTTSNIYLVFKKTLEIVLHIVIKTPMLFFIWLA